MQAGVARRAKCNQVLLTIITGMTAELLVVNFEIRHRAASLASPVISHLPGIAILGLMEPAKCAPAQVPHSKRGE